MTCDLLNSKRLLEIGNQEEEVADRAFLSFSFTGSKFIKHCELAYRKQ